MNGRTPMRSLDKQSTLGHNIENIFHIPEQSYGHPFDCSFFI